MRTPSRPAILSRDAACHGTHENVAGREWRARSAAIGTPADDDEAWEFVAADAPPTLASSVHFFGAAPLIDSTARWAAVLRLDTETTFSCFLVGGGPASGCPPLRCASGGVPLTDSFTKPFTIRLPFQDQ